MTVETRNIYGVSISGNKIVIPPFAATLDRDEALNLSVYLALAVDPNGKAFSDAHTVIDGSDEAERLIASVPKDPSDTAIQGASESGSGPTVYVECIRCLKTKAVGPGELVGADQPMCPSCGSVMVPLKAKA